jgi:hypothetical protein
MVENPFLTVPQVESPASRSWEAGFLYGFQGPRQSSLAQGDVEAEDTDAFNQGVLAGQTSAIEGLELADVCVDLNVEGPSLLHFAVDAGAESAFSLFGIAALGVHVAGLAAEAVIAVVNLSIALETFSEDPGRALAERADRLHAGLNTLGFAAPMELFVGGGVDISAAGCELKATRIFRSQADAAKAAKALGRSQWLVVSWRTDQSGGARVVEAQAQ